MKIREAVAATMTFLFAKPGPVVLQADTVVHRPSPSWHKPYIAVLKGAQVTASNAIAIAKAVDVYSTSYGVPPAVLLAIIEVESDFRPYAVSKGGDLGLMQVRLVTARLIWKDTTRVELLEIDRNIHHGALYLKTLHEEMVAADIEGPNEYHASIIAYNAGPSAARRAMAGRGTVGLKYYAKIRKAIARWQKELA